MDFGWMEYAYMFALGLKEKRNGINIIDYFLVLNVTPGPLENHSVIRRSL